MTKLSRDTNTMEKMSNKVCSSKTTTLFMSSKMSSTHNLFCKRSKDNQLEAIKVSKLIELLQRCDPDAEICFRMSTSVAFPAIAYWTTL